MTKYNFDFSQEVIQKDVMRLTNQTKQVDDDKAGGKLW